MKISSQGLNIIKHYEGCRLKAYLCPARVLTIGWGHTGKDVTAGKIITQAQADSMLIKDLERYERNVMKFNSKFKWNQNEFDALVSFAYNLGSIDGLVRGCNSKDDISKRILLFNRGGGVVLKGLVKRRKHEQLIFNLKV